jgi:hypothetical protein
MAKKIIAFDVMSMFHLFSAVACIHQIGGEGGATIYVSRGLNGQYCCKEGTFFVGGNRVLIKYQDDIRKEKSYFRLLGNVLLFLLGRLFKVKPVCYILHHTYFKPSCLSFLGFRDAFYLAAISFEEGIGSYGDVQHYKDVARRENKKLPVLSFLVKNILAKVVLSRFSVLNSDVTSSDAEAFKNAVSVVSAWLGREDFLRGAAGLRDVSKKFVILFTTPYVDMYGVSEEDYECVIRRILAEYEGFHVVVKPHPLEKKSLPIYAGLNIFCINDDISGEEVLMIIRPKAVVGFYSGVLLVSKNVYGIEFNILESIAGSKELPVPSASILKLFEDS